MASEAAAGTINGTYVPQQPQMYGMADQNYAAHAANHAASGYSAPASAPSNAGSSGQNNPSTEEIGWYFVERYYNTLSRNPEKLYLFYTKRSQFVAGLEEEKVPVCMGQKSINERIKELDYQDCKVRVTNVDTQSSDDNILLQVLGEISNKSAPHRKFAQSFVLAPQMTGYFVLNDIFRYILDEEEEEQPVGEEEAQQPVPVQGGYQEPTASVDPNAKPDGMTNSADAAAREQDAQELDSKLENLQAEEPATEDVSPPAAQVNGTPVAQDAEVTHAEEAPAAVVGAQEAEPAQEEVVEEAEEAVVEAIKEEKPKAPEPKPVAEAPKPAPAAPAEPPKPATPAAPLSWASRAAAANRVATPKAAPGAAPTAAAATPQTKATPPSQTQVAPAATTPTAPAAAAAPAREDSPADSQGEWQTAGHDHNKRQSRVQSQTPTEPANIRAYIKNVFDSIDAATLKNELAKYGEIAYFDISRQKNCAFVDFATPEGFQTAMNANPHQVGDEQIYVEERRFRPGSYPYVPRGGSMRGGARGGADRGRGRGGFPPRGRGNVTPRGRGGASTAA